MVQVDGEGRGGIQEAEIPMSTITIDLDDDVMAHVKAIAAEGGQKVEDFLRDLVATHAGPGEELTPEQIDAIQRGLDDLERGDLISNEDVFAQIDAKLGQ
jgi:predicted transcriptional regulator